TSAAARAAAAARPSTDERACSRASTNLGDIALGVALAFPADARGRDCLRMPFHVNRGHTQRQRAGLVQTPTAVHVSDFAVHRRAGLNGGVTGLHIASDGTAPALA